MTEPVYGIIRFTSCVKSHRPAGSGESANVCTLPTGSSASGPFSVRGVTVPSRSALRSSNARSASWFARKTTLADAANSNEATSRWAEVPALPGCATEGETMDELIRNLHEAIEGCLSVDVAVPKPGGKERVLEIAV